MTTSMFPIPISYVADELGFGRPARRLQREARKDQLLRVLPGAYAERSAWAALTPEQRHLLQIAATLRRRPDDPVLFGESAAVLLGLPTVRPLRSWVHVSATDRTPPASSSAVRWFRGMLQDEHVARLHGVRVTDLRRTAVDLARSRSFPAAVAAVDAALRPAVFTLPWRFVDGQVRPAEPTRLDGVDRDALARLTATSGRGVRTAREAIEFGDPLATSPGESFSRAHIHLLGFPPPLLQRRFVDPDGSIAVVDFDWPDYGVSGEFDGFVKYSANEYLGARFRRTWSGVRRSANAASSATTTVRSPAGSGRTSSAERSACAMSSWRLAYRVGGGECADRRRARTPRTALSSRDRALGG